MASTSRDFDQVHTACLTFASNVLYSRVNKDLCEKMDSYLDQIHGLESANKGIACVYFALSVCPCCVCCTFVVRGDDWCTCGCLLV